MAAAVLTAQRLPPPALQLCLGRCSRRPAAPGAGPCRQAGAARWDISQMVKMGYLRELHALQPIPERLWSSVVVAVHQEAREVSLAWDVFFVGEARQAVVPIAHQHRIHFLGDFTGTLTAAAASTAAGRFNRPCRWDRPGRDRPAPPAWWQPTPLLRHLCRRLCTTTLGTVAPAAATPGVAVIGCARFRKRLHPDTLRLQADVLLEVVSFGIALQVSLHFDVPRESPRVGTARKAGVEREVAAGGR